MERDTVVTEVDAVAQARAFQFLERRVEERTREIERRRRVSEGLRDILAALNSNRPMHAILDVIVSQASRLLGVDIVAIFQLGADNRLTIQASTGLSHDEIAVMTLSVGQSASGQAVLLRKPVVMATDSDVFHEVLSRQRAMTPPEGRLVLDDIAARVKVLLAVPLTIKDTIYGSIGLYSCTPRVFAEEDIALALAFGDQAALAIENARLRERAELAAVIEERARLARDLHDSVTQSLYSLTLFAEATRRVVEAGDAARAGQYLERLGGTAQQALKEMRLLVHQLRPLALAGDGLIGALQQRLEAVEGRAGIQARLLVDAELDIPPAIEAELYHIAQEALNNALKHAAATAVTVHLSRTPPAAPRVGECLAGCPWLILDIRDNGHGFDPEHAGEHGGLGLVSLRERAARLHGTLAIRSAPGAGTIVEVCVPMEEDDKMERYPANLSPCEVRSCVKQSEF